jgi:hypothetical protein
MSWTISLGHLTCTNICVCVSVCRDLRSRRLYQRVARVVPVPVIFRFLSEIRQDPTIRNRGAIFVVKVREDVECCLGREDHA